MIFQHSVQRSPSRNSSLEATSVNGGETLSSTAVHINTTKAGKA